MITVNEDLIMSPRFICPHCHSPVDPASLEFASSAQAYYRICPVCDEAVLVALAPGLAVAERAPAAGAQTAQEHAA
jgi:hypothetical protein